MTTYSLQPLNYINENLFIGIEGWEIHHNQAATLTFQLTVEDALGTRRFIPPTSSQVRLQFIQARAPSVGSSSSNIDKHCVQVLPNSDKSMYQVTLLPSETSKISTGGATLVVTINGQDNRTNLPYMIKKVRTDPGF